MNKILILLLCKLNIEIKKSLQLLTFNIAKIKLVEHRGFEPLTF
jgi:hypothetical protein